MNNILKKLWRKICALILPKFGQIGDKNYIQLPHTIKNPQNIYFSNNAYIGRNSTLISVSEHKTGIPSISIGNNVWSTSNLQIYASKNVTVEDDVIIAANVYITDSSHDYSRGDIPYRVQGLTSPRPVLIGKGSWIGQNVCILPGVTIGEQCIIGANSVVNKDIPPFHIAVGAPAKIIKKWDSLKNEWVSTKAY